MVKVRRRNWSSTARRYADADAIFVSIPKSGRTWLRVFLYSYFCAVEKREFTLKAEELADSKVPKLVFTHDLWEHLAASRLKDRWRGKHLIPSLQSRKKLIVLLARDPRDVIVSLFFQLTKRGYRCRYQGSLSEMMRHEKYGIAHIIDVMNTWMAEWGERRNFKLIRYEDCQKNAAGAFREVLIFLGFGDIDPWAFNQSLQFSSFENMKAMETTGQLDTGILSPGDPGDPESFKVRRGIVGGYRDYFNALDIDYLNNAMARLDARYGYGKES